jgi:hypothetical protein
MRMLLGLLLVVAAALAAADTKFTNRWFHPELVGADADTFELESYAPSDEGEEGEQLQHEPIQITLPRVPERRQGRKLWAITADYFYCYEPLKLLVAVPAGFVSDLASIPAAARFLYDPADFVEAAFVHDYLYAIGEDGRRETADEILKAMIIEANDSERRAFVVHSAVRAFGDGGYKLPEDYVFYDFEEQELIWGLPAPPTGLIPVSDCKAAVR